jgi:hypothetical protein
MYNGIILKTLILQPKVKYETPKSSPIGGARGGFSGELEGAFPTGFLKIRF